MMKQLTLRGFDPELERKIREISRREGISLNRAVLRLLRKGAGLGNDSEAGDVVGDALDRFIGTWSDAETREVMDAVKDFEVVDESLWE